MSIKNPEQDLYETIQFVREGKDGLSGKTKSTSDILKKAMAAKGDGGARYKKLSPESQKYLRDNPHDSHHIFDLKGNPRRGTTKEDSYDRLAGHDRHQEYLDSKKYDSISQHTKSPKTGQEIEREIEKKKLAKKKMAGDARAALKTRNESFDDDDNAIIEEIKNRVIAILGEKVAGQEGEGQSGSGARRRANIPPTADSKFLELRKKRQQQTRQAPPE